jgi:hypothetical protein
MSGLGLAAGAVDELSRREVALLWAFRAIAVGRGECPLVRSLLCGRDADAALANMLAFVRLVGWRGSRRLRLHLPNCLSISEDERLVLSIFAAAEAAMATGDADLLRGRVGRLLGGASDPSITAAASAVVEALAARDDTPGAEARAAAWARPHQLH